MPNDHDDEVDARLDEEWREKLWANFVREVLNFQESENWSGVLAAIARAMREQDGHAGQR